MPPAVFPYRVSVIRRSLIKNAVFVAIGSVYFAVASPLQWHWVDVAMLAGICFYSARLAYDIVRMTRPLPILIIDDHGVRDPALGNMLVPWQAIKEIRIGRFRGLGQLFLIAASEHLTANPGGIVLRLANWIKGARAGRKSADMALPMSPSVALDATLDDIVAAIQARPQASAIAIVEAGAGPTSS